jgi:exosortase D (VPLPA-CTERM-specific)
MGEVFVSSGRTVLGSALLGLATLAAIPVFAPGMAELGRVWLTPEYSHGPLIPVVSAYLLLREMSRDGTPAPMTAPRRTWPGVLLVLLSLAVGLFGTLAGIPDIVAYGLILWVGGMVLTGFGWDRGKRHWAPVLHLVFMLPLPQMLYWQMSIFLQLISSEIGVALIRLAGIPVYLDGNVIDLGVYKLQVAEACSGLRYLFPILSFSYLFAILYRGPMWQKAVLLLLAAPLTVVMNSIRIGVIGILVDRYGIAHAEGFLHVFEGWVIFGLCIAILFATAAVLQRMTADRLPLSEAIDMDVTGLGQQLARVLSLRAGGGMAAAGALGVAAAVFILTFTPPVAQPSARNSFGEFPPQVAGWSGRFSPLDPETVAVLQASDYILGDFFDKAEAAPVNLFSAWYADQSVGSGIHSPEVCLPVGGWEVVSIGEVMVTGADGTPTPINRAVIQKGLDRMIVHYWFAQRGSRMTSAFAVKLSVIRDGLATGRRDGALVRLTTPVMPGESDAEAEARLMRFAGQVNPILPDYVDR